jgi:plastocyanin
LARKTTLVSKLAGLLVAAVAWLIASSTASQSETPETIVVHLSNFAFTPDRLLLHAGTAVTLRIVNDSGGSHNLSAPALFAGSAFPGGSSPVNGKVELDSGQSQDIMFMPRLPGTYKIECRHFLHSLFGMTGIVVVDGPVR